MSQQVLIWSLVVAAVVVAIVLREFHNERNVKSTKHKFIEIGKESEIFFCPGDIESEEKAAN